MPRREHLEKRLERGLGCAGLKCQLGVVMFSGFLSRARSEDWRDGSLMSGGWLVAVGHEWWGRGERVGASGGFSPPCPTAPVGTGAVGR